MPKLFRVLLPVSDIERAASFYAAVLGQQGYRVSPGRHYFDCEGTILACYDPAADGDGGEAVPLTESLYLAVDDLKDGTTSTRRGRQLQYARRARCRSSGRDRGSPLGRTLGVLRRSVRQPAVFRRSRNGVRRLKGWHRAAFNQWKETRTLGTP
ncbi:MAG: hypothetical protein MPN21_03675 [Thermoanaerobaculia bacterium]|nr:hypothetical protein [Thermoanaerobaculia bacterium]